MSRPGIDLHAASVPVFLRYLERLNGLVDAAAAHADAHGLERSVLLDARLADDMHPFAMQVVIAANFALRACFPLAGQAIPPDGEFAMTVEGLRARIARVAALVASLRSDDFIGAEARPLESLAGDALVTLAAPAFLFQYALPNFFFHVTTAYAVLRSRGVALGKEDFDGFHSYRARDGRGPE